MVNKYDALNRYLSNGSQKDALQDYTVPNGGIDVYNVLDTKKEPNPEGYTSFLEFWMNRTGEEVDVCASDAAHVCKSGKRAETDEIVGAHVRIDGISCPSDWAWIVPLCKKCNNDDNILPIKIPQGVRLVAIHMSKAHKDASQLTEEERELVLEKLRIERYASLCRRFT